jgi:hypothetical protein
MAVGTGLLIGLSRANRGVGDEPLERRFRPPDGGRSSGLTQAGHRTRRWTWEGPPDSGKRSGHRDRLQDRDCRDGDPQDSGAGVAEEIAAACATSPGIGEVPIFVTVSKARRMCAAAAVRWAGTRTKFSRAVSFKTFRMDWQRRE